MAEQDPHAHAPIPRASSFSPPGPKTADPDEELERAIGHRVALGAVVGFLSAGLVLFGAALLVGLNVGSAIGLGLFAGFWSGAIAGGVVGGLTVIGRQNAAAQTDDPDAAAFH